MDNRLNRAVRRGTCRLGVLGLAIAISPGAGAQAPSDWNVIREPVEPGQLLVNPPTMPLPAAVGSLTPALPPAMPAPQHPAAASSPAPVEPVNQMSTALEDLPLLPPGPAATSSAPVVDLSKLFEDVSTPRQIQTKRQADGVPANLVRVPVKAPSKQPVRTAAAPVPRPKALSRSPEYDSAIFESTQATAPSPRRSIQPSTVMPGFGSTALREQAAKHLDDSVARLSHRASLTAGAEAIEALRLIAQAKDLAVQSSDNTATVETALTALKEAEDFVDRYGTVDGEAITRMVRAHQTIVLKAYDCSKLTGTSAADTYLDTARRIFADLAATDPLAAHAVTCLAKSYRQRAGESRLALAAAVHLMRAAVIAVPNDRQLTEELASVLTQAELRTEAQHVQALAQRLAPRTAPAVVGGPIIAVVSGVRLDGAGGQAAQAVRLEQLTPEAFSQVSRIEGGPSSPLPSYYQNPGHYQNAGQYQNPGMTVAAAPVGVALPANATLVPAAPVAAISANPQTSSAEPGVIENQVGNPITRAMKSMTGKWK